MQHAGAGDVVDERAVAGEQPGVFDAGDSGACVSHVFRSNPRGWMKFRESGYRTAINTVPEVESDITA